jgi:3-deoxy-D-manno-octulosonic-acid transferase
MIRKAIFALDRALYRALYRLTQALAFPAILIYLLLRVLRNRKYLSTLGERFGDLPPSWQRTVSGSIWLHAVSVGEVLAAVPLIEELAERRPAAPLYLSVSTMAGRETAEKRLGAVVDQVFYAPLDFVWAVRRVLRRLRPSLLIVMETEIWPNLFREARRVGCGLAIVNGRISDRAFPLYRKHAWLFGRVLSLCDRILVQSEEMRERFIAAGAPPAVVEIAGNLKYDFRPGALAGDSPVLQFITAAGNAHGPVWVAASTSSDDCVEEEDFVLAAQGALTGWRLILAPRKPERFDSVARKLEASGLRWTRRTALRDPEADVLLLDSIGELSGVFAHADVVFMGGTLAEKGGHNILEPALFGKPVIAGPHLENFRDIERHFEQHDALLRIQTGADLGEAVLRAAGDHGLGARALAAAEMQRGATARTADSVMKLYDSCYPSDRPAQPVFMFLWFFAQVWKAGSAWDLSRKRKRARQLPVPVVSVGNITAGGTGKTPATIELLHELRAFHPAVLTRGHGRGTGDIVLLPTGDEQIPVALTGDEAQLYVRGAHVPIGIGGERYEAGLQLLDAARVGTFILDDGFQHLQLKRDFDLVLIDSLHPFGGGELIPLGRLREPLDGLARADAFIITRANEASNTNAIESVLRRHNRSAPIFRSYVAPRRWTNDQGEAIDILGMTHVRSVAFCGLGNPQSFWRSLDQLGVTPVETFDYGDHHRYTPVEIRRLARYAIGLGVEALITTAKDAVNLPPEFVEIVQPLRVYWLEIGVEIRGRAELMEMIAKKI